MTLNMGGEGRGGGGGIASEKKTSQYYIGSGSCKWEEEKQRGEERCHVTWGQRWSEEGEILKEDIFWVGGWV